MYELAKKRLIKDVELEIGSSQVKPAIGKVWPVDITIRPPQKYYLKYVLFEVVNERTDKRAPMDRITSRSLYLYRFNVEKPIETVDGDNKYSFKVRIPVHKEPSRDDKFICIKWLIQLKIAIKVSEEDEELLCAQTSVKDLEVVSTTPD